MIFIFTGPTLHPDEAHKLLEATYLPPVSQGDVYRACLHRPTAIGIIDGYFDQVPAVWHKEILWALNSGIKVFGSSSMGALRASELAPLGMVGVGRIYEMFCSGELEDDDEVALMHSPPEFGYRPLSEAMVNIRATLNAALTKGVITATTHDLLRDTAKALYYGDRHYQKIVGTVRERGFSGELEAFLDWLPAGKVNQKRLDAYEMLQLIRDTRLEQAATPKPAFYFEYTTLWDQLSRSAGHFDLKEETEPEIVPGQAIVDELRLSREWPRLSTAALALRLADAEIRRQGVEISDEELDAAIVRFCREHNLAGVEELDAWVGANHLNGGGFMRLLEKELKLRTLKDRTGENIVTDVLNYARLEGMYPELARRTLVKRPIFAQIDAYPPSPEVYEQALAWYLGNDLATFQSIQEVAESLGFEGVDELRRAVLGEFLVHQTIGVPE